MTLIRVGNDEYARLNRSFGLTTLEDRHARVTGTAIRFRFRGKSGRQHEVGLRDRRLAAIVRRCQDLPGQELFQYLGPDGVPIDLASDDVNAYLREISGADVTAKDFRTWAATILAYRALRGMTPGEHDGAARKQVVEAVRVTADHLGNTPAVARGSYVHPAVLDAYLEGSFRGVGVAPDEAATTGEPRTPKEPPTTPPGLPDPAEEAAVVRILRRQRRARQSERGSMSQRGR
jgi:DNA topoisomerase-1